MASGDGEMPGKSSLPPANDDTGEVRAAGAMRGSQGVGYEAAPGDDEPRNAGPRPDFRVVQAEYDTRLGKTVYKDIGAMWKNVSKSGNEFYTMKIGKLKLLVFQNNLKDRR
jgi:hypothetical protein